MMSKFATISVYENIYDSLKHLRECKFMINPNPNSNIELTNIIIRDSFGFIDGFLEELYDENKNLFKEATSKLSENKSYRFIGVKGMIGMYNLLNFIY